MTRETETLKFEIEELRKKNRELEETLDAIRSGEVDAIIVSKGDSRQVYTLEGIDHPYRALIENIREGALTLSRDGLILYTNTRFAEMVKQSPDMIPGKSILDFICPESLDEIRKALQEITNRSCRARIRIRKDETRSLPVLISMNPLSRKKDTTISVVVTDRRKDEERIQLQARMLDSVADAVIAADMKGKIIYWNDAATRTYGWKAEEVLGKPLIDVVVPAMSKEGSAMILASLIEGKTGSGEYLVHHRDGHIFPIYASDSPVFDDQGQLIAVLSASHDITERKRAEKELKQKNDQLLALNEELKTTQEELEQNYQELFKAEQDLRDQAENLRNSNRELEQFAYVASHDLREPLRMVTSFSQLLAERYAGKLDTDADEFIEYIVDGATRMDALVDDLLEFSRVTSQARPFEPADMNAVLGDALLALSIMIRESGAEVNSNPLPVANVDRQQMTLVFQNLISNAIKFNKTPRPVISVAVAEGGGVWTFSVKDNGIGIDPAYREKIFDIFKRLHTRGEYPGTGIGLAICRRIVERHGGKIWVESEPGKGSTFLFTIPKGIA